jgi:large subunit ribosomal protein L18
MPKSTLKPRITRHRRLRSHLAGTAARPRLAVWRSLTRITAQLINDDTRRTLCAVSSQELTGAAKKAKPVEQAAAVGKLIAERAKAKGVAAVVFDRGGSAYHGRVKALADGAREGGLKF